MLWGRVQDSHLLVRAAALGTQRYAAMVSVEHLPHADSGPAAVLSVSPYLILPLDSSEGS